MSKTRLCTIDEISSLHIAPFEAAARVDLPVLRVPQDDNAHNQHLPCQQETEKMPFMVSILSYPRSCVAACMCTSPTTCRRSILCYQLIFRVLHLSWPPSAMYIITSRVQHIPFAVIYSSPHFHPFLPQMSALGMIPTPLTLTTSLPTSYEMVSSVLFCPSSCVGTCMYTSPHTPHHVRFHYLIIDRVLHRYPSRRLRYYTCP